MNKTRHKPTASKLSLLRQLCNLIPTHLVPQLARATGNEAQARTFSPWSHVVSLLYAQVTHSLGLNDVCDALRLRSGPLSAIRGATPPSKNGLSHANRQRDPQLEVDGQLRDLVFLTNNVTWSAQTIADLYRCRKGFHTA